MSDQLVAQLTAFVRLMQADGAQVALMAAPYHPDYYDHMAKPVSYTHLDVYKRQTLRRNGTATIVGIYEKPQVQFAASRLVTHEIHIQGAQGYCWDFPIAIAAARDLPMEKFITHTFPLDEQMCIRDRFTGTRIEWMKKPGRGAHGHIALATADLPAARRYLEEKGFTFDDASAKYLPDGRVLVLYANEEIGGFAIHLMQK